MASVYSKIIAGELPGRFVYSDADVVAFLTIAPVAPGHTLVVPRAEVDKWTELTPAQWQSLARVAQLIGKAVVAAFDAPRAGTLIAGFEVPHTHIHVFPAWDMQGFDLSAADPNPDPAALDDAAAKLRTALEALGAGENVHH